MTLNVAQKANVSFKLDVGSKDETVTVDGSGADINTTDATVSTVIDRQFVENIPLNGRTLQSLITDAPGVVTTTTAVGGEQGQFSSVGQRPGSNYFTVDGVSANFAIEPAQYLAEGGNGALPALSALGTTASLVSLDELQEFRLESSTYTPEFGRGSGAQIVLLTRSGTSQFHGSVYDYFRNDAFGRHRLVCGLHRATQARERQNDFGGTLGGPIYKDKTFFFFSYEGLARHAADLSDQRRALTRRTCECAFDHSNHFQCISFAERPGYRGRPRTIGRVCSESWRVRRDERTD